MFPLIVSWAAGGIRDDPAAPVLVLEIFSVDAEGWAVIWIFSSLLPVFSKKYGLQSPYSPALMVNWGHSTWGIWGKIGMWSEAQIEERETWRGEALFGDNFPEMWRGRICSLNRVISSWLIVSCDCWAGSPDLGCGIRLLLSPCASSDGKSNYFNRGRTFTLKENNGTAKIHKSTCSFIRQSRSCSMVDNLG